MTYQEFIAKKLSVSPPCGITPKATASQLFQHQDALVNWALRRGRCAIFADTGLGKTRMELEWARQIAEETKAPVLILAPLAVAAQTKAEAQHIGIDCQVVRDSSGIDDSASVCVTNYDRIHLFDPSVFGGVVLDESSVIKHHDAKTFSTLTDAFLRTPYRLAATATPSPNDWTELGTHAEFLGICTRAEMLSEYFCHDGGETQTWRLKGHARHAFWKWVCSWGSMIRKPSDLGFSDDGYNLPPLDVKEHRIECAEPMDGFLFAMEAQTLQERRASRRASIASRVEACASMVNADASEPWVVWCELNDEGDALEDSIPGSVQVSGSDTVEDKENALAQFADGSIRVLISKPSIAGWGLNWQHCARMAFVGVNDSFESYYQAVRRCYRFGQKRSVQVHLFASDSDGAVLANLARKESIARDMAEALAAEVRMSVLESVTGQTRSTNTYKPQNPIRIPSFL